MKQKTEQLTIAARRGDKYIKFKAKKSALIIINKMVTDWGSDELETYYEIPYNINDYIKWKDHCIPLEIEEKGLKFEIVCGEKYIHFIIRKYKNLEDINKVLRKYSKWAKAKK
jgi:hypothetical protein